MRQQRNQTANLTWRRFPGTAAAEFYLQCRPQPDPQRDVGRQTISIYRALDARLRREHGSLGQVVYETVFFRNIRRDFEPFHRARLQAFEAAHGSPGRLPASTCIQQPPLEENADLVVSAIAVVPRQGAAEDRCFSARILKIEKVIANTVKQDLIVEMMYPMKIIIPNSGVKKPLILIVVRFH